MASVSGLKWIISQSHVDSCLSCIVGVFNWVHGRQCCTTGVYYANVGVRVRKLNDTMMRADDTDISTPPPRSASHVGLNSCTPSLTESV